MYIHLAIPYSLYQISLIYPILFRYQTFTGLAPKILSLTNVISTYDTCKPHYSPKTHIIGDG